MVLNKFFATLIAVLLVTAQTVHSETNSENPLVLDGPDYNVMKAMFQTDFNRASELWNSDYDDRHKYGEFFADIVDKFGLPKFERFLSLISPMVRYQGADHGMNCASIENFGGKEFENFTFFGMLFGRTTIVVCVDYFSSGISRLDVGVKPPHPFVP